MADDHWGKDLDGLFHNAVDGPCSQLDHTELKVGRVPAVALKPQMPIKGIEGLFSLLLHQPPFVGQRTKDTLNGACILALYLISFCLEGCKELIINSLKGKGNHGDNGV